MSGDRVLLDFEPVIDYVVARHPDPHAHRQNNAVHRGHRVAAGHVAELLDVKTSTVIRWRRVGLGYFDADAAATALGVHPSELWDDWWSIAPSYWRQRRAAAYEEALSLR